MREFVEEYGFWFLVLGWWLFVLALGLHREIEAWVRSVWGA